MRRWVVALLVAGIALGVLSVAAVVTTSPEDGANIGAGFLLLLAVPATVTGLALRVMTRQGAPATAGAAASGPAGDAASGSAPAGWSLALGVVGILIGIFGVGPTVITGVAVTAVGVAVSITAVVVGRAVRRRAGAAPGVALGGLVTGIFGLVLAVLQIVGLVLDATIG